jgi:hypothetical protein
MEDRRLLNASSLKNSRAVFKVNTLLPNIPVILAVPSILEWPLVIRLLIALKRSDIVLFFGKRIILSLQYQFFLEIIQELH